MNVHDRCDPVPRQQVELVDELVDVGIIELATLVLDTVPRRTEPHVVEPHGRKLCHG